MMTAPVFSQLLLSDLLSGFASINTEADRSILGLCMDSREVKAGDLFFAVKGLTHDASVFIDSAIRNGAIAVVWETEKDTVAMPVIWRETPTGQRIPLIAIAGLPAKLGLIADRFYHSPSKDMHVVGITGTNGKTSCSQYLAQALSHESFCGVMGTLGAGIYGGLKDTNHTTPDALHCHRWLAEMHAAGVNNISMEVSSHALDQGRVNGIEFDCAVFTNLSRDHLDYHGDLENYALAKQVLFGMPGLKQAVINVDDTYGRKLFHKQIAGVQVVSYGLNKENQPDVYGHDLVLNEQGMQMIVSTPWGAGVLKAPLLGRFNASNLLAVLSVLLLKNMPLDTVLERLALVSPVAGRMEAIKVKGKPHVIIDYAHTPDALEHVLSTLREHCNEQLWCVFGCGGDRDQGKRTMMGGIASQYADHVVLTNDNPRTENPGKIIADIQQGVTEKNNVMVETDRARAIEYAIENAGRRDIVLIAGKGHEDYQIIGNEKQPFSDIEQAKKYLGLVENAS
ncbi:MAG: UDP-N-acetylmuramoyl-L-alanyl-D-glutamate--2,6-diaminopimelate ligase [Gammaproteobacteria bacterium]|nr:UDP-N-acetylmuramoyl-L-alanyl-D-glutamate--2,6-diaminopimelate ligase [Gammaproteobacteria bacterium]